MRDPMTQPPDVDPEILAARALQAGAAPGLDVTRLDPATARRLANQVAMVLNDGQPALSRVETLFIPGPGGELRARLYQAEPGAAPGTVFYIHGGGWFSCDIDTHDRMLRALAAASGLAVFALDYRLSPEHVFPAALEDCQAAWGWLRGHAAALGVAERIAVAGDSAGANLAVGLMLAARDAGAPLPAAAALLYGCYAPGLQTASRAQYGGGLYGLTGPRMDWYWKNYLGPHAAAPPPLAAPFHAGLRGLPPHFIGIAARDVLADENRLMAARLRDAGVAVTLTEWQDATHGFLQMTRDVRLARAAVAAIAAWLKEMAAPSLRARRSNPDSEARTPKPTSPRTT